MLWSLYEIEGLQEFSSSNERFGVFRAGLATPECRPVIANRIQRASEVWESMLSAGHNVQRLSMSLT